MSRKIMWEKDLPVGCDPVVAQKQSLDSVFVACFWLVVASRYILLLNY